MMTFDEHAKHIAYCVGRLQDAAATATDKKRQQGAFCGLATADLAAAGVAYCEALQAFALASTRKKR